MTMTTQFDPNTLLPGDFEAQIRQSVQTFWTKRGAAGSEAQPGGRASVIGGKNLDGFIGLVETVTTHIGLPNEVVLSEGRSGLALPGFFRPSKDWDVLVKVGGHLLAAFEFKSHVGPSFGNNANNRAEEAMGSGVDLQAAIKHGALTPFDDGATAQHPPFVGYLMLLEDCEKSRKPVRVSAPHFPPFPEFVMSSYAQRYRELCARLVQERLYSGAALLLSPAAEGAKRGAHTSLSDDTSARALFGAYAAHAAAFRLAHGR
jgi:hypothetical protein